jgi:hypothetical protein
MFIVLQRMCKHTYIHIHIHVCVCVCKFTTELLLQLYCLGNKEANTYVVQEELGSKVGFVNRRCFRVHASMH